MQPVLSDSSLTVSLLLFLHRQHSSISRHCLPFDVFAFFILSSKCMLIVTSGLSNATLDAIFSQAIDSSRCSLVVTLLLLFVHFSGKVVKGVGVVRRLLLMMIFSRIFAVSTLSRTVLPSIYLLDAPCWRIFCWYLFLPMFLLARIFW